MRTLQGPCVGQAADVPMPRGRTSMVAEKKVFATGPLAIDKRQTIRHYTIWSGEHNSVGCGTGSGMDSHSAFWCARATHTGEATSLGRSLIRRALSCRGKYTVLTLCQYDADEVAPSRCIVRRGRALIICHIDPIHSKVETRGMGKNL